MSFGMSPSDVVKLLEFSNKVYVAFRGVNDSSGAQVADLTLELESFHHCLKELSDLMKEYGKPLPFPYLNFKKTLQRCEETIKPYADHLVDERRMTFQRISHTLRYIGKEKEVDGLRKQLTSHHVAMQTCIMILQLRLRLQETPQTQRLLDIPPFRSLSVGGHVYTSNLLSNGSRNEPLALPPPDEEDQLYKEWVMFQGLVRAEQERNSGESNTPFRPSSLGNPPLLLATSAVPGRTAQYALIEGIDEAIALQENRAKRLAAGNRMSLSPNDAIRREVRAMPPAPQRTFTVDTDFSISNDSTVAGLSPTISQTSASSITTSPSGSPQIREMEFDAIHWGHLSSDPPRSHSVSIAQTTQSAASTNLDSHRTGLGIDTAGTTPDDTAMPPRPSISSIPSVEIGDSAMAWTELSRKVIVERTSSKGREEQKCTLHWRSRENAGLSIRAVYKSGGAGKVWITQHFPASGPSIPLTTTDLDGDVNIDFPRASFGKLDKSCTDIKYTFSSWEPSIPLQTLLYTNSGSTAAELLFDRPVVEVSSDRNGPECRGKNIRLWKRSEDFEINDQAMSADVLTFLFYTSFVKDERKRHWVEEPHYAFQWLDDTVYKKSSEKLKLVFSKDPARWQREKLFSRRRSSQSKEHADGEQQPTSPTIHRNDTHSSVGSNTLSLRSSDAIFGSSKPSRKGNLNRYGYSELEIKFRSRQDRDDFLKIWKQYVKPKGHVAED